MSGPRALAPACAEALAGLDDAAAHAALRASHIGLEKESLRVDPSGHIAQTAHPRSLGSALTHPYITTDFSEALLEFVTPPFDDPAETLRFLYELHTYTYARLADELLWCTSMPCMVGGEDSIPIADYGRSNVGTMKRVYRKGLSQRYGRTMQTIAGVHFNVSLGQAVWPRLGSTRTPGRAPRATVDSGYFGCVRNFLRFGWLVPLLFGSSPAVCKTFLPDNRAGLESLDEGTYYLPYATSLRMSDIGYTNATQAALKISYDSLDDYVRSLTLAITTPHPAYERIGVQADGRYIQLNANVLQIENEFYSSIRPKQITRSGEKPTVALQRRGVRYLEIRSLDLDPFSPVGVTEVTLRLLEALVLLCAALPSPGLDPEELVQVKRNMAQVPRRGRDPALLLNVLGRDAPVLEHAEVLLDALEPVCQLLDSAHGSSAYSAALRVQRDGIESPHTLPSARVLAALAREHVPFFRFAMNQSIAHANQLKAAHLDSDRARALEEEAARSLAQQRVVEESDRVDFAEYLRRYFNQKLDRREKLLG